MAKSSKKKKQNVFMFYNAETGEHYVKRLSKIASEKLSDKMISKFSKKLRKHTDFAVKKLKKG